MSDQGLTALEFYAGLGGMHMGLVAACPDAEVRKAFEINNVATDVYRHNFKSAVHQGNIEALSVQQLDKLCADMWLLAPPCQPYTRQGLKKESQDNRAASFLVLLQKLQKLCNPPRMLLIENVVGFESSDTRDRLMEVLQGSGYRTKEFILSPLQYGTPYSRPRYFCLAKRGDSTGVSASTEGVPAAVEPAKVITDPPYVLMARMQDQAAQELPVRPLSEFLTEDPMQDHPSAPPIHQVPVPRANKKRSGPSPAGQTSMAEGGASAALGQGAGQGAREADEQLHGQASKAARGSEDHGAPGGPRNHQAVSRDGPRPPGSAAAAGEGLQQPQQQAHVSSLAGSHAGAPSAASEAAGGALESGRDPWGPFWVPAKVLQQSADVLDVVTAASRRSKCFTKNYAQYNRGTGSLLCTHPDFQDPALCSRQAAHAAELAESADAAGAAVQPGLPCVVQAGGEGCPDGGQRESWGTAAASAAAGRGAGGGGPRAAADGCGSDDDGEGEPSPEGTAGAGSTGAAHPLRPMLSKEVLARRWARMRLRYFTPREIANLHGFLPSFSFPGHTSLRQRYQLLGNSLSVAVVADLVKYLVQVDFE